MKDARTHVIDISDDYERTIYAEARKLLNAGATPADTIETWLNGKLSMTGNVGRCAKLTVRESKHGKPSLSLVAWVPFPATAGRQETATNDFLVLR